MPLESILFLALVIAALSVFTATLAYAQWVTRNVVRDSTSTAANSLKKVSREPAIARSRNVRRVYEEAL
jgi:cytochrome c